MGSKARESAKAMSLAFVLLDFQHACGCQKKSVVYETECVGMQQFGELSRTRTMYSLETHTSDFILNTFRKGSQCSCVCFPEERERERERSCHNQFY